MAELADAPDLGSGGQPCRFDPCYPHHKKRLRFAGAFFNEINPCGICKIAAAARDYFTAGATKKFLALAQSVILLFAQNILCNA